MNHDLLELHDLLLERFGPQHWWPGDTPFEIVVGAILTQSTSWRNVEKAIKNLKDADALSTKALQKIDEKELATLIRPAGYYNAKSRKLKGFISHLHEKHAGCLEDMFSAETQALRCELLSVWGVGPETADSIILYAAGRPVFVVDAYTRRIFSRMGYVKETVGYEELRSFSEKNLPCDARVYNEFHALLVALGKLCCKKTNPECIECPLSDICRHAKKRSDRKEKGIIISPAHYIPRG